MAHARRIKPPMRQPSTLVRRKKKLAQAFKAVNDGLVLLALLMVVAELLLRPGKGRFWVAGFFMVADVVVVNKSAVAAAGEMC